MTEQELMSALEAIIYAADEPATLDQIVAAITGEKPHSHSGERNEVAAENFGEANPLNADANAAVVGADVFNRPADPEAANLSPRGNVEPSSDTPGNAHDTSRAQTRAVFRAEVRSALDKLVASYAAEERGIEIRKVAGGWKMYTKAQHHELVRRFIKGLRPPLRLTMPALETLSVIAYKQPVTLPEINEVRGVNCGGVVKTLLERRLITTAGRKEAVGRPILYRTSKDFLMRFGLADLDELPSLKEFEQLAQAALGADDGIAPIEPDEASVESPQESLEEPSAILTAGAPSPVELPTGDSSPAQASEEATDSDSVPDDPHGKAAGA
jgi:segregation and condensation protein B